MFITEKGQRITMNDENDENDENENERPTFDGQQVWKGRKRKPNHE